MRKYLSILLLTIVAYACTPTQKLKYTIDNQNSPNTYHNVRSEKTIQPYDYLYIKIYSLDEKTAAIFGDEMRMTTSEELVSYSVNDKGYINFPFVGQIYVKDLTIDQAKEKLEKELNQYLTNISVRVRFVANKITVLGEVQRPGNITFYDEKITIFDALGYAGDVADYGDKTKLTLIREKDGNITYHYLDMTNKNIVQSDYYYLQPNDVLIVNPIRQKYTTLRDRSWIYAIASAVSTLSTSISIYTTFVKNNKSNTP